MGWDYGLHHAACPVCSPCVDGEEGREEFLRRIQVDLPREGRFLAVSRW